MDNSRTHSCGKDHLLLINNLFLHLKSMKMNMINEIGNNKHKVLDVRWTHIQSMLRCKIINSIYKLHLSLPLFKKLLQYN